MPDIDDDGDFVDNPDTGDISGELDEALEVILTEADPTPA